MTGSHSFWTAKSSRVLVIFGSPVFLLRLVFNLPIIKKWSVSSSASNLTTLYTFSFLIKFTVPKFQSTWFIASLGNSSFNNLSKYSFCLPLSCHLSELFYSLILCIIHFSLDRSSLSLTSIQIFIFLLFFLISHITLNSLLYFYYYLLTFVQNLINVIPFEC